jgi:hypothetical protein
MNLGLISNTREEQKQIHGSHENKQNNNKKAGIKPKVDLRNGKEIKLKMRKIKTKCKQYTPSATGLFFETITCGKSVLRAYVKHIEKFQSNNL